jgi:hypothetical protein
MKKITFLVASIFLIGCGVASASGIDTNAYETRTIVSHNDAKPIAFNEGGIAFYLFADGEFDFDTDYRFRKNNRGGNNVIYVASGYRNKGNHCDDYYGVKVVKDYRGVIRRIGNVSLSYDDYGRVRRIGSIQMSYNRYALDRVGGLEIVYNRRGVIVEYIGSIKGGRGYASNQGDHCAADYGYVANRYDDYDRDNGDITIVRQEPRRVANVDIRIQKRF